MHQCFTKSNRIFQSIRTLMFILVTDERQFILLQDHSRFVNSVRYSPNGELFVSGGAEGKVS